jgi:hypothetical protein
MTLDQPSTSEASGGDRDSAGRFTPGNRVSRGNPHAARVAQLRSALLGAVTPEDVVEVVRAIVAAAKSGDVPAAKELLLRLLGPPEAIDVLARVEQIEERLRQMPGGLT